MQRTHVPHNIFRSPVIHLTSHDCHGGGARVTSGTSPKYQAPCREEWMLEERAHVIAQHKMTSKRKNYPRLKLPVCGRPKANTETHVERRKKEGEKEEIVK
ncbi:hypothetical protein TcG_08555 [Trypanosoma cruzi]|nr:hypothetical protein TcG_08555 [Trypanosoma cruzi]